MMVMMGQTVFNKLSFDIRKASMQPSKRPALYSPTSLPPSHHPSQKQIQPALDCERIEKYIEFIKLTLKNRLKDKKFLFEESQLKDLHKHIKAVQIYHLKNQKDNETLLVELRTSIDQMQTEHDDTVKALKRRLGDEIEEKQRAWSQKILALNNDNGRKEQTYKETIQKLMNALASAQKSHQQLQGRLNVQMQAVGKILKDYSQAQRRDHYLANAIHDLVEEIALRQQNSLISSKSAGELSLEQIDLPLQRPHEQDDRDSCIDISGTCLEKQLQAWLMRLICFGLFQKQNEDCLKKMIGFTKAYQQPTELLEEKIFPVIMEMLTSNMLKNQDKGWRYLQGSSGIKDCWDGSQIELRNINNLSELDINNWQVPVIDSSRDQGRKAKFF